MEKYNLTQTGQEVQDILNGAAMQVDLTAETERATEAEQTLDGKIDTEKGRIDALEEKIPSGASSSNKLATEEYVDDSVATATATFRGTFNLVSDLDLTVDATEQQIAAALAGAISTADNNDYAFVQIPTSDETPTEIAEIDRYKYNGSAWAFEYALNNSGFTAAEWAAINSGITSELVTKLGNLPTAAALAEALASKQNVLTFDSVPTEGSNNPVKSGGVYSAIDDEKGARLNSDAALQQAIEAILRLILSAATSLNQLADKAFVNSSISTATATFKGTFNMVNDLHLTLAATHAQIGTALASAISDEDNNDYCFVQIPTVETAPNEIAQTDRYKFNGTSWEYEYTLNNSGFTSAQWTAINSGITSALVSKLSDLPTNSELTTDLGTLTSAITAINQKIPSAAAQNNKLVDTAALESYIVQVLGVLTVSYNITSTDGHVTLAIQQTDGKITSVSLTTSDIASAAALNLKASQADLTALASRVTTAEGNITTLGGRMTTAEGNITTLGGRMTTAEGNITSLGGRVSTNETDIANLQQLYNNLQQSKPLPVTALPQTGQQKGVIYRLAGTTSYSDYMWNGSIWVLMATYNNAIDPRPKKGSTNLVESGGVFDNMGALDISELNATENPHTLATYADLSAALAAIPSNDYKKGGMSIKFVQSSDNKYVQYRLTSNTFTTTASEWQKQGAEVSVSLNTNTGHTDITVGGVTTSVGSADEVTQINDEINGISEKTYNMSDGAYGYVNYSDGGIVNRASAQDYYLLEVSVQPGCKFSYGLQGPTVSAIIAAYDIDGNYLQGKSIQGTAVQATGTYTVEDGVSILRFSCGRYTTPSLKRVAESGLKDDVDELKDNLQQVTEDVDEIDTELDGYSGQVYDLSSGESAYVAYSDGGIVPRTGANDYYMLEVQDVKVGQIFKYSLSAPNVCAIVAAYDAEGNYLQSKSVQGVTSTIVTGNYVVQSGVTYLRFTTSAGSIPYGVGVSLQEKKGIIEKVSILEESVTPQNYPFAGVKLSELTLNASATRNIDGTVSLANGGKAYWETPTVAVAYTLSSKFVYHTGLNFSIGKDSSSYGGRFVLRDGYIDYYAYSLTDGTYNHTTYETGISLVDGEKYSIFIHRIQNYETGGRTVTVEVNGEYNEHYEAELSAGPWYGRPFVQADGASCTVVDFNFAMHLDFDLRNAVVGVWGHSYVEGDSLGADRMKSFTNLLGGVFGYDKLFNFGWGGDYAQRCLQRIQGESRFTRAIKYALIVIGANDAGNPVSTTTGYMNQMAEFLIGIGITPVFATPNPLPAFNSAGNQVLEDIADWIKESGYKYFDMRQVFIDANGNVRTSLYLSDNTHPTVEGHQLIFKRIKMDCPYLF